MLAFIICLCTLPFSVVADETGLGKSFIDTFQTPDPDVWDYDHEDLNCVNHTVGFECVYVTKKNRVMNSLYTFGVLRLDFKNDCEGEQCCHEDVCTPFTSGTLKSKQKYGYGSYRWHAIATKDLSRDTAYGTLSCFTVESEVSPQPQGMSLCAFSHEPEIVATVFYYGEHTDVLYFKVDFPTNDTLARYRIDFFEDSISWIVNGDILHGISAMDQKLPSPEVHIEMGVFANDETVEYPKPSEMKPMHERPHMDIRMRILRFRFIEENDLTVKGSIYPTKTTDDVIIHDEPMIVGTDPVPNWKVLAIIGILATVVLTMIPMIFPALCRFKDATMLKKTKRNGEYHLFEESKHLTTVNDEGGKRLEKSMIPP